MKIRKDDLVVILSWNSKDKGKQAKVLKVFPKTSRVVVEGIQMIKRSYKKTWTSPGQIVEKEASIHVSNVALVCPFTSKPTRVWFVMQDTKSWKQKKFRFSKKALKEKWGKASDFIIK